MENQKSVEKVNRQLYVKLNSELKNDLEEMHKLPTTEVIDHSFEIAIKTDICFWFENNELPMEKAESLLAMDNPLNAIYDNWMEKYSYMDTIMECTEDRADIEIAAIQPMEADQER